MFAPPSDEMNPSYIDFLEKRVDATTAGLDASTTEFSMDTSSHTGPSMDASPTTSSPVSQSDSGSETLKISADIQTRRRISTHSFNKMTTNTLISNTFATSGTYSVLDNGSSTLTDALALITAIPNSTGDSSSATSGIPNDETVTVYTYNSQNSLKPSIELIVPTITTNTLPTGLLPASSNYTNSSIFTQPLNSTNPSISAQFTNSTKSGYNRPKSVSSWITRSSLNMVPSEYPKVSTYSSSGSNTLRHSALSKAHSMFPSRTSITKLSSSTSVKSKKFASSALPTTSSSQLTTTSSRKPRTTITQYLEDITYTQVYVVTDSRTTVTTALLATTSFYVTSLDETYSISPPAITTDLQSLKSRLGFDSSIFKKKIGAGAVAGIAIGAILGLLLLLGLFIFYFLRKRKNGGSVIDWLHGLKRSDDHYSRKSVYIGDASHYKENGSEDSLVQTDSRYYNSERYPEPQIPDDPTSNSTIKKTPPLVNRDKKPSLFLTPSPIKPALTVDHSPVQEDEFDMSLFDMRSELNKINDSTDTVHYLFPPAPAPRKTVKGINSIDKMNYQVDDTPTTPIDRLPIDRTMSVLYESPNEQCIWDEFESAKDSGLMNDSGSMTNAKNYSADTEFDTSKHGKSSKCDQIFEQLRADGDYDDTLRDSILSSDRRVRSGSGAKRYEYIVNNVSTFKNELEKERLGSPLKSTFGFESMDDTEHLSETPNDFPNSETVKEFIYYVKKVPPPIPKPRKNI